MSDPWMKFYAADWRSDPRLKMCSAAARGVWIEMICLMHEATPYGHLLIHGQPPNEAQLASLTGIPHAELPDYVAELERMGVFSRTKEGVIYSRKLVRMASRSAVARKNGKKGGSPALCKDSEKTYQLNLKDKADDKTQKPEARSQKEECCSDEQHSARAPSFDDFWSSWPLRKVSKDDARKAYSRLTTQDRANATTAAREWAEAWKRENPKLNDIHPSTYLNAKRWTDEPAANVTQFPSIGGPNVSPRQSREAAETHALRERVAYAATTRSPSRPDIFGD